MSLIIDPPPETHRHALLFERSRHLRCLEAAFLAASGLMLLLRFVNVEADFPPGVTVSGALYSDEGWYSNAAIAYHLTGSWHVPGDFNAAPTVPVFPLIQTAAFSLLRVDLTSARLTHILLCLVFVAGVTTLTRLLRPDGTYTVVALVLSTNFFSFAYSRLAILEMPMLTFVTLALIAAVFPRRHLTAALAASVLLVVAVLTKTTALFGVPVILYALWSRDAAPGERWRIAAVSLGVFVALLAGYRFLAVQAYPVDVAYFQEINIQGRILWHPVEIGKRVLRALWGTGVQGALLYALAGTGTAWLLLTSAAFRRDRLVRLACIWFGAYIAQMGFTGYQPDRYFLPTTVPVIILFSTSLVYLYHALDGRRLRFALCGLVALVVLPDSYRIARYLATPAYSFRDMAHDIGAIVRAEHERPGEVVLLAEMGNSLTLESGVLAVSPETTPSALPCILERFRPRYYVMAGLHAGTWAALERRYRLERVRSWDVFENFKGWPIHLFRLAPRSDAEPDGGCPNVPIGS